MILDFGDVAEAELGEVLWTSFVSARLVNEPALRALTPRPEWANQDAEMKFLWDDFARRLIAFYGHGDDQR